MSINMSTIEVNGVLYYNVNAVISYLKSCSQKIRDLSDYASDPKLNQNNSLIEGGTITITNKVATAILINQINQLTIKILNKHCR